MSKFWTDMAASAITSAATAAFGCAIGYGAKELIKNLDKEVGEKPTKETKGSVPQAGTAR